MIRDLFRTKSVGRLVAESEAPAVKLRRVLGPVHLTMLGIGGIIGAGIFSSAGVAAAGDADRPGAGPALILSFVLVAIACGFAALCYAEFASMVPVSGSAYTYAYATLGELIAWMIGWDLIIEYAIGNVAVAISWSAYFQHLLHGAGMDLPAWLGTDFRTAMQASAKVAAATDPGSLSADVLRAASAAQLAPKIMGLPIIFNVPAAGIVALLTWLLVIGIRESATWNTAMVVIKLVIVGFFVVVGAFYVQPENWTPFAPNGFKGVSMAAALIFFAYIGFDAVTTAAEETRNPQRDLPISIIASLVACTVIYVVMAAILTGMADWKTLGVPDPLAAVFAARGLNWAAAVISVGAVIATTTVLLVFQLGQPRIFFAMARDGLLPGWAAKVHPKYQTPHVTTILTGVLVAVFAGVANIDEMVELTNIGTLFAFVLVSIGIIILRRTDPTRARGFRTPWVPVVPLLAVVTCVYLMTELPLQTWIRFGIWMAIGLVIYAWYGRNHSALRNSPGKD